MSSEGARDAATNGVVATYAFQQLEAPPAGAVEDLADVLSSAWAEAEQIREQARATGEAEGRAAGLAAARAEAQPTLDAFSQALEALEQTRAQLVEQLGRESVEVALRLSEKILAGTIAVQPERVIDVARNALRHLAERQRVILVVHPSDLETMSDAVAKLQAELGGIDQLGVQADRRVARGGVIARTEEGEIDSSIEVQLSRARDIVTGVLADEAVDGT